jgi:methyl-accepting chemotaxis protein
MPRESATLQTPRKTKPVVAARGRTNGRANGHTNGHTNGHANGHKNGRASSAVQVTTVDVRELMDLRGQIEAINLTQAVIEFELDGTIIHANDAFLSTVGYTIDEVKGRHHRMFVDQAYAASHEYAQFWKDLNAGKFQTAEYKRFGKGGKEIWIQASYTPTMDFEGKPFKVVKYATDVTAQKMSTADFQGQLSAISKAQAVIEFNLDGSVLTANENFLAVMGYRLDEVKGRHHRLFVEPAYAASHEYTQFWADLNAGTYQAAEYKRIGKGGKEVWIQASYNPIFDLNGKPYKVVKYATDISASKALQAEVAAAQERERAAAEALRAKVDAMLHVVNAAARGDLTQEVPVKGTDAIGQMGEGLAKFISDLRGNISRMAQNANSLAASSEELTAISQQMSNNAAETSAQANVVSAASEQVSKNVQTVATGAEEMSASIKEIAKNANEAAKVATAAVKVADTTNETVTKLGESSAEIGNVLFRFSMRRLALSRLARGHLVSPTRGPLHLPQRQPLGLITTD